MCSQLLHDTNHQFLQFPVKYNVVNVLTFFFIGTLPFSKLVHLLLTCYLYTGNWTFEGTGVVCAFPGGKFGTLSMKTGSVVSMVPICLYTIFTFALYS